MKKDEKGISLPFIFGMDCGEGEGTNVKFYKE